MGWGRGTCGNWNCKSRRYVLSRKSCVYGLSSEGNLKKSFAGCELLIVGTSSVDQLYRRVTEIEAALGEAEELKTAGRERDAARMAKDKQEL